MEWREFCSVSPRDLKRGSASNSLGFGKAVAQKTFAPPIHGSIGGARGRESVHGSRTAKSGTHK